MPQPDRQAFLRFATGCPTLPPGGLSVLDPPLSVTCKSAGQASYDQLLRDTLLPSASTCFNQLKLPAYSSREVLHERLYLAMYGSKDCIDFT